MDNKIHFPNVICREPAIIYHISLPLHFCEKVKAVFGFPLTLKKNSND